MFRRFKQALDPLAAADRLGGVLMQYGPGLAPSDESREFIELGAELLAPYPVLVEFRQRDWLSEQQRRVDARLPARPQPVARDRRRAARVDAQRRPDRHRRHDRHRVRALPRPQLGHVERQRRRRVATASTTSTPSQELSGWVAPLADLAGAVDHIYAMFNTNNADQGPVNADLLRDLLRAAEVPVTEPPGPAQASLF